MISEYKKSFEPLLAIIARPFLSWNPSILTFLSVVSSVTFFAGIVTHIYVLSLISICGFLFDALDGYIARKAKKESPFGAFLDSSLDRVSDFFMIFAFGFAHLVSWELTVFVLFTSFFISYLRSRAEAVFGKSERMASGIMQRSERIILLVVGFFLFLLFPTFQVGIFSLLTIIFLVIFFFNCITILQRFIHYRQFA